MNIKDLTDDKLIAEAKSLNHQIYVLECYGMSDLTYLMRLCDELELRGYEILSGLEVQKTADVA